MVGTRGLNTGRNYHSVYSSITQLIKGKKVFHRSIELSGQITLTDENRAPVNWYILF